jgi:hypothetical protein
MIGALNDFTSGGPGLRHTSVGEDVVGLNVNDVLSAEGAGSEDSVRDHGRWDVGGIVKKVFDK